MDIRKISGFVKVYYLIFIVAWSILFISTDTINSGFHLTDDHEIITFNSKLKEIGLFETLKLAISEDLEIRFRPFYYFQRVLQSFFWGDNFLLWSISRFVMLSLTTFFLFRFFCNMAFPPLMSLFLSFIILVGKQFAIWWRLGPNETIGILFLALSLLYVSKASLLEKKWKTYSFISIGSLIIASCSKESFILFIPAYIGIYIHLLQKNTSKSIKKIVQENLLILSSISVIFLAEISVILFWIGSNEIHYAGVDQKSFDLLEIFYRLFKEKLMTPVYLLILFLFISLYKKGLAHKLELKSLIAPVIIFFLITLPQNFLYLNSGLFERYYLPFSIGIAYIIAYIWYFLSKNSKLLSAVFTLYISILLVKTMIKDVYIPAREFTDEGNNFKKTISLIEKNVTNKDIITLVSDPVANYEWTHSLLNYKKYKFPDLIINILPFSVGANEELVHDKLLKENFYEKHRLILKKSLHKEKFIIVFKNIKEPFQEKYHANILKDFLLEENKLFVLYIAKKATF